MSSFDLMLFPSFGRNYIHTARSGNYHKITELQMLCALILVHIYSHEYIELFLLWFTPFKFSKVVDHVAECVVIDVIFASHFDIKFLPETHPVLLSGDQTGQFQLTEDPAELRPWHRAIMYCVIILKQREKLHPVLADLNTENIERSSVYLIQVNYVYTSFTQTHIASLNPFSLVNY